MSNCASLLTNVILSRRGGETVKSAVDVNCVGSMDVDIGVGVVRDTFS